MPSESQPSARYASYRDVVAGSFSRLYDAGKDSWAEEDHDAFIEFVLAHTPDAAGERLRLLDVGCGRAIQTAALGRLLGADCTGIDLLEVWPPELRQVEHLDLRVADFMAYTDEPFDVILDKGVFHHQRREDWGAWVAHGHDLLRPGGRWFVHCFLSPDGRLVDHPSADGRSNWWLPEHDLLALFEEQQLAVVARTTVDRDFFYEGHWLSYLAVAFEKPRRTDDDVVPLGSDGS